MRTRISLRRRKEYEKKKESIGREVFGFGVFFPPFLKKRSKHPPSPKRP